MPSDWFAAHLRQYGPDAQPKTTPTLREAEAYCRRLSRQHYENFVVASVALPKPLRRHFYSIYAFCRWADDMADETGDSQQSLQLLDWWEERLDQCYDGRAEHPVFIALRETICQFAIPSQPFRRLLSAFRRDQHIRRYDDFEQVIDYCHGSADPVGELILYLGRCHDRERVALSDKICTGLQLANFWQDIARDYRRGRIYVPREDIDRFRCSEADFAAGSAGPGFRELLAFEVDRAERFFCEGTPLQSQVPRWLQIDIELFIQGGLAILQAIRKLDYDVLHRRPTVRPWNHFKMLAMAQVKRWRLPWPKGGS